MTPEKNKSNFLTSLRFSRRRFIQSLPLIPLAAPIAFEAIRYFTRPEFVFDKNLGMFIYNDDKDKLEPQDRLACVNLTEAIKKDKETPADFFEFYPETPFGPAVNVGFSDGKIRCYTLQEGIFVPNYVDVGDNTYTCRYNHKTKQLDLFDPFNPDPGKIAGHLDSQNNFQPE